MALTPILQPFFTKIDTVFGGFFLGGASNIATAITPIFKILVTLFVILWGLAVWRGLIQEPMSDGITRIVKIVLIGVIALNAAVYGPQVANTIYKTPEELSGIVMPSASGPAATSSGGMLDAALDKGNDIAKKFIAAITIMDIGGSVVLGIQAILVWIFTGVLVGYAAALVLLAKIGLAVVLAIGPLFIALLLFDATKAFFQGWLAQALNFLFMYVLVALTVALALTFFDTTLNTALSVLSAGSSPDFVAILPMLIVGVAIFIVLKQVPGIASGLAGGVQLSTLGAVGWAMRSGGRALGTPARAWGAVQRHRDRNLMRQYYRSQIAATPAPAPAPATPNDGWLKTRLRGHNSVTRK